MWRRKHNRRRAVSAACSLISSSCLPGLFAARPVSRLAPRPALLAYLICPAWSHRLIRLSSHPLVPARLIRSLRVPLLASSRSPLSSAHRLALASYRSAPRCIDKRDGEGTQSTACCHRMRMAAGAGRGCLLVLGAIGGAARSSLLPISSAHPIGYPPVIQSSHHPIDGEGPSFPFRLTPSRLLFSACLPGLVPPSPAGGCVGCGMACDGGREGLFACLLSCSCRSLTAFVRSLLYAPCRLRRCAYLGRCRAFHGLF